MRLKQKEKVRPQINSLEGEFFYELENQYGLSPKLSSLIMLSVKRCLLGLGVLSEGQIEVIVVAVRINIIFISYYLINNLIPKKEKL